MTSEKKYEAYNGLYKHYSDIIFKARVSIITGIILSYGYIFHVIPNINVAPRVTNVIIPICSSLFIAGVFMVEVAYSKRFFDVISCLRKMEPGDFYYRRYERKHWQFSILYFYASIVFNIIWIRYCFITIEKVSSWSIWFKLFMACGPIAVILLICVYYDLCFSYDEKLNPDNTIKYTKKLRWWIGTFASMLLPSFSKSFIDFHFAKRRDK